jgi:hypothetical protein
MAETLVKVIGSTASKVSLSSGYLVNGFTTIYIPMSKLQFDEALCDDLAYHITHSHITVYVNGVLQTADDIETLTSRYTDEAVHEHTDFQESLTARHDPTAALPVSPADGARYWALATARGWTINRIYVYQEESAEYEEIIPTAGTQVYIDADSMLYIWNGTALSTIAEGTRIRARFTGINVKTTAAYTAVINGISTDSFVPTNLVGRLTAVAGGLNGNLQITVGTSVGGTQILPATPLTGLTAINNTFSIPVSGLVAAAILANATLHTSTTFADTGAGTGTLELWVEGVSL